MKERTIKILTQLILFLSLTVNCSFAQHTITKPFYALFQEIEFEVLHVYSFPRIPGIFPATGYYQYKGTKIDSTFYDLMDNGVVKPINREWEYTHFFATFRFHLTSNLEVLLVREFHEGTREQCIHYLIYDRVKEQLIGSKLITNAYEDEGFFEAMESWILDLNEDGQKDILTRSCREEFLAPDAYMEYQDRVSISIWSNKKLLEREITDTILKKQLEADFPYYKRNELSYATKQNLSNFLKKKKSITSEETTSIAWCIIAGSDKDLQAAEYELERAKKILGNKYKYGLDDKLVEIHKKNNRYYTVVKIFKTKVEAEIALVEIKNKINKTAYIVNLNSWCKELKYQQGEYYKCVD